MLVQLHAQQNSILPSGTATAIDLSEENADIMVSQSPVWPGDFNNDGIADNRDLLYWAVATGNTGAVRPNATLDWTEQGAVDWTSSVNGINSKCQDGNGDGIVNADDLDVLAQNYGGIHSPATPASVIADVRYRLELVSSVLGPTSTTRTYDLYVESLTGEPINTYGFACNIDFGNLIINNISADFSNSALNPDEDLDVFHASTSTLDIALSRTDGTDPIIDGVMVKVIVITDNVTSACPFTAFISQGAMMSRNGEVSVINDALFYGSSDGGIVNESLSVSMTSGGTYEADYALDSDATIQSGKRVEFKAGEVIELGMGFSVEVGAEFSSQIQNCGGE